MSWSLGVIILSNNLFKFFQVDLRVIFIIFVKKINLIIINILILLNIIYVSLDKGFQMLKKAKNNNNISFLFFFFKK